jgi:hypothetical protein
VVGPPKGLPENVDGVFALQSGGRRRHHAPAHVVLIPRYGHIGYCERYNEKIVYAWLWALKNWHFS